MGLRGLAPAALAALFVFAQPVLAQPPSEPPELVPVNPKLSAHTNWFEPVKIYDLQRDHYPLPDKDYPKGLSYRVYSAVGYDLANTIVVKGPNLTKDGLNELVIIDTLGNPGITKDTIAAMRKAGVLPPAPAKLPIRAIIFTHNHIDHAYGVDGYLDEADRPPCQPANPEKAGPDGYFDVDKDNPNCIAIIGQTEIDDGVGNTATVTGTIIDARSSYMYGSFIPRNHVNDGIGPQEKSKPGYIPAYRMPSRTFSNQLLVKAAGVQMKLIYVPSETNDELSVFVPDARNHTAVQANTDDWGGPGLLFSAEVIQGPSFPNLYSLRGTTYRNPATWFRSVDRLRTFDSWCMVPSHGPPLCERKNIQTLLRSFRDAIQFTHDQTIRWMNKGYNMDQLAPIVEQLYLARGEEERIMKELDEVKPILNVAHKVVDPRDYLRPFYGSVPQAVREIYVGSVGWFQADPTFLRPTPPDELAKRYVALMGGGATVNQAARVALGNGDPTFAAELTTNVIRAFLTSTDKAQQQQLQAAKEIKARALLELGAKAENPNWRNWYITGAFELQGYPFPKKITGGLVSPGVVGALPAGAWVNSLTMRLRAEDTARLVGQSSIGFWFPAPVGVGDQGFGPLGYMLIVRGGIAEFVDKTPAGVPLTEADVAKADYAISIEKATLDTLIKVEADGPVAFRVALRKAYDEGRIKPLNGTIQDFEKVFFEWFDPKPVARPPLVIGLPTPDLAK
ncbi:MAG TPA: alkyl sulfatase dimerization domain-containing protein [Pseudolabrys sp.]|nr:alkyl sulfatase dimerization domain-containing protein [Pseudolabrys sp.]